jgi:predicted nuclease of predicted toxin-antitoxin system
MASRSQKSKKPSAASSESLPDFTVFLDATFGRRTVASRLRDTGVTVEVHDDHFPPGTPDDEWLSVCGQNDWIVISQDQKIRYRKNELAAAQDAGVRLFVLTAGSITGEEAGDIIVSALPGIQALGHKQPAPFVASVTRAGNVRVYETFSS